MIDKPLFPEVTKDRTIIMFLGLYGFLLLLIASKMSPFYFTNEWADPNVYFNVAKAMLNGHTLYTETFDHKGPFIFFIYGLGYLISNTSFIGMFIIEFLSWLVMLVACYYSARFFVEKNIAFLITIIFPIFLVKLMKAGGSAEEFILVFSVVSLCFFLKYFKDENASVHNPWYMFLHGVLCSMTFFIKLNLIMFWFFPLLGIFICILFHKEWKNFFLNALAFLAGFAIIAAPICIYLYTNNALQEAFFVYIELNAKYSKLDSLGEIFVRLFQRHIFLYQEPFMLAALPAIGIFVFPLIYIKNKIGKFAILLSGVVTYMVIYMAPVFQYYYPIPFLVFDLLGLIGITLFLKNYITQHLTTAALVVLSVLIYYIGINQKPITNTKLESSVFADKAPTPGLHTERLYREIMKEPNPTLLNLGFGLGNSLFTTCNIVPNVRYFMKPNLKHETYPELRLEQIRYLKEKKTQFVLVPNSAYKRNPLVPSIEEFDKRFFDSLPDLQNNYRLVLSDTVISRIDENAVEMFDLYKRID